MLRWTGTVSKRDVEVSSGLPALKPALPSCRSDANDMTSYIAGERQPAGLAACWQHSIARAQRQPGARASATPRPCVCKAAWLSLRLAGQGCVHGVYTASVL